MESIGIDWKIIIVQAVNFLILFLVLRWLLYRPILKMLNDRKNKIDESLKLADKSHKDSEELEKRINEKLETAKKDALSIIEDAKKESENLKKDIIEQTEKESHYLLKKAEERIIEQKREMMAELRKETVNLTILVSEKILGKKIDETTEKDIIEKTIKEME